MYLANNDQFNKKLVQYSKKNDVIGNRLQYHLWCGRIILLVYTIMYIFMLSIYISNDLWCWGIILLVYTIMYIFMLSIFISNDLWCWVIILLVYTIMYVFYVKYLYLQWPLMLRYNSPGLYHYEYFYVKYIYFRGPLLMTYNSLFVRFYIFF